MSHSSSLKAWFPRALAVGLCLVITAQASAQAPVRLVVDTKSSLAWWQINPHMDHLWATSCPEEPSWRPGEGRSAGWVIDRTFKPAKHGSSAINDTTIIPVYPRRKVRSVCTEAVSGRVLVADTMKWTGVRGQITVKGEHLITGEKYRDEYAHGAVMQTNKYPDIKFTIDSLIELKERGDTLVGYALGIFTLRGVAKPVKASVRAFPEAGGLRVLAKFNIPAPSLVPEYGISNFALGMGVGAGIWYHLYMGVDLVLRPETAAGSR